MVGDRQDRKACGRLRKRANSTTNLELAKAIGIEADYFQSNKDRMRYPEFRQNKLLVGSGIIKAGCQTVIGSRLKPSGMFWTVCRAKRDHRPPFASAANLKTTGRRARPDRPLLCRAPVLTARSSSRRSERWSGFRGSRKPAHDTGLTPTKEADFLERCLSRKLVVEVLLRGIQQRILGKQSSCRLEHLACVRGVARLPEAH